MIEAAMGRLSSGAALAVLGIMIGGCDTRPSSKADARAGQRAEPSAEKVGEGARKAKGGCALVSRSEMESILGSPVESPRETGDPGESKCDYPVPGGISTVGITIDWNAGDAGWKGATVGRTVMDKTAGDVAVECMNETVGGLGDEAFVQSIEMPKLSIGRVGGVDLGSLGGGQSALWVKKGQAVMSIIVANQENAKEKSIAIAREALRRM
jgi:hypothetical protein